MAHTELIVFCSRLLFLQLFHNGLYRIIEFQPSLGAVRTTLDDTCIQISGENITINEIK